MADGDHMNDEKRRKIFDVFFNQSRWHAKDLNYRLPKVTYCVAVVNVNRNRAVRKVLIAENVTANQALSVAKSHAEIKMINKLKEELKQLLRIEVDITVDLYINYSPCYTCANALAEFRALYRSASVNVIAATAWYTKRPSCIDDHRCGIAHKARLGGWILFNKNQRLTLKAFTESTWQEFGGYLGMSAVRDADRDFASMLDTYWEGNDFGSRSRAYEDTCMAYDIDHLT